MRCKKLTTMATETKQFDFYTQLRTAKGDYAADAHITGTCAYDTDRHDYFDCDFADIAVTGVSLKINYKEESALIAYYADKVLLGELSDTIDKEIHIRCNDLFFPEVAYDFPDDGGSDAERNPSIFNN